MIVPLEAKVGLADIEAVKVGHYDVPQTKRAEHRCPALNGIAIGLTLLDVEHCRVIEPPVLGVVDAIAAHLVLEDFIELTVVARRVVSVAAERPVATVAGAPREGGFVPQVAVTVAVGTVVVVGPVGAALGASDVAAGEVFDAFTFEERGNVGFVLGVFIGGS